MARAKRSSPVLETGRQRLAGIKSISPAPDFGAGLTLDTYEQEINVFATSLDTYNEMLSGLDHQQNLLEAAEKNLKEKNQRMLAAVQAMFGPDSSQFEQAGGKRTSERKRPTRSKPTGGPLPPTT